VLLPYLPMLEWLPRLRLKGSALPLSGSLGSVSFGAFLTCFMKAKEEEIFILLAALGILSLRN
jgi:hypothetical protein